MPTFDWRSYLDVARLLADQADQVPFPEAAYRSAVSRAYYAAYGYALHYAISYLGFRPRNRPEDRTQDHGRLRGHLRSRRRAKAALVLDRLRDQRNKCDYVDDVGKIDPNALSAAAIQDADELIHRLLPPTTSP